MRENMTELATQQIPKAQKNDKAILQKNYEKETFSLMKGKQDEKMMKAKNRVEIQENIQKNYLNKYFENNVSEKEKYLKKIVE
jgi:hypothetical protein